MKSKIIKIIGLAAFSVVSFYTVRHLNLFDSTTGIEPKRVDLSQCQLNISEIATKNHPIWYIKTENPTVAYTIVFKNEGRRSFAEYPGLISVLDSTLLDGAGDYDSSTLKELLIDNNIELTINFTDDDAVVTVYTIADNFELSVELLDAILTKAHLSQKKLEINRDKSITALSQNRFSAEFRTVEKLSQTMFPQNHPYRINLENTLRKLPTYKKKDYDACYEKLFTAENAMITFAGNLPKNIVEQHFTTLLNHLKKIKNNNFREPAQVTEFDNYGKLLHIDMNTPQSAVCFALPAVAKNSQDRFAFRLGNNVLGGVATMFTTRLFKEVRDKAGLTYGIYTRCSDRDLLAALYGQSNTRPENVAELIEKTKAVIKDFAEKGITEEELEYHKIAMCSKNVLESTQAVVRFATFCRMDNIESKYLNNYLSNYYNLTLEDVNKVIKKYFDCNRLIFVSAGKNVDKNHGKNFKGE